jgi:WhiB family redox-sensing transcriptional regulator
MTATATATRRVTTLAAPDTDWRASAACRYVDPDLHFPIAHTPGWLEQIDDAKQVCAGCPVRKACLEWALKTGQSAGVWGGLSERERKGLRRPRATSLDKCLSQRAWIEKQLDAGVTQKSIAGQLGVDKTAVSKAVRLFSAEREQAAAAQGVTV